MNAQMEPAAAVRLLDAQKALAVDVREPDEYAAGHIPGALLLPLGQLAQKAAEQLPDKNAKLLLYCRSGVRSARACTQLERMGYTDITNIGGVMTWPYELET